jgi:glycosyltransferase involved in cell wall biosynthesis
MRIVHYLNHSRRANGHVAVAVDLACEQAKSHETYLVSAPGDFDEYLTAHGVSVVHVDDAEGALRLPLMAARLFGALRRIRPDVVNAHMVAAALAARSLRPWFRYKIVTTVHNSFDRQARLMAVGDRVIAVSDAVKEELVQGGIPASKVATVTNGTIGGGRRPLHPKSAMALHNPAVVTICGLHERKGVNYLIDAFDMARRACPEAHLYIVGEGPDRGALEAQARNSSSADNIHFLGYMDDPREVLASADIFALASLRDPFPLVLLEARQMGNAIVASAVDGIPQALAQGEYGLLVPPADAAGLAEALIRLLTDPDLRASLSIATRRDIEELHVDRMSTRTLQVYEDALRG